MDAGVLQEKHIQEMMTKQKELERELQQAIAGNRKMSAR